MVKGIDKLVKAKRWMGMNEDYGSLMDYVDNEVFFMAMKNEQGEMWPFMVEVELTPGEVKEFWKVERLSWFSATLLLFETTEDLDAYLRLKEVEEQARYVRKEDGLC